MHGLVFQPSKKKKAEDQSRLLEVFGNAWYMRCTYRSIGQCRATGVWWRRGVNQGRFVITTPHENHINGADHFQRRREFLLLLHEACTTQFRSTNVIYEEIAERFPDISQFIPYERIEQLMRQWMRQRVLPQPRSYEHFAELINGELEGFRHHNQGSQVNVRFFHDNANPRADIICLTDPNVLNTLNQTTNLYISTIQCDQHNFLGGTEKLLFISTEHNRRIYPLSVSFIRDGTAAAYSSLFEYIRRTINAPNVVFSNFDQRINAALANTFRGVDVRNTLYSYCSILHKEFVRLGIEPNEVNLGRLRSLMALALLPSPLIAAEFERLFNEIDRGDECWPLYEYFNQFWMIEITPDIISIDNSLDCIKDVQRVILRVFIHHMRHNTDSPWQIMQYFLKMSENCNEEFTRASPSRVLGIPHSLIHKGTMTKLWNKLNPPRHNRRQVLPARLFIGEVIQYHLLDELNSLDSVLNGPNDIQDDEEVEDDPEVMVEAANNAPEEDNRIHYERAQAIIPALNIGDDDFDDENIADDDLCTCCQVYRQQLFFMPCRHAACKICLSTVLNAVPNTELGHLKCHYCRQLVEDFVLMVV